MVTLLETCSGVENHAAIIDICAGRVNPDGPVTVKATVLAIIHRAHPRCPFVAILGDAPSNPCSTFPPQPPACSIRLKVWAPRAAWAEENIEIGDVLLAAGCTIRPPQTRPGYADDAEPFLVLGARAIIRKLNSPATTAVVVAAAEAASPHDAAGPSSPDR